ncbi:hypothetical protein PC122_g24254 [Phytophthora cactorum]|nr:hypothetical protein PC122_g24254 [Phytophthora cactorum]
MLHHAKLDKCFWAEAAMTAIYVKNRLPSPKIEHKTPFEIVYKSKPSVKHMRVFGCRTYILTPKEKRLKWDPKARAGIFLGYEEVSKAYRLYDIEAGQVVISRDVNFDESTFGLSPRISDEDVDDLDVDSLDIDDDGPRQTEYKQTGKRKSRPSDEDEATRRPHTVRHRPGLEEASAPDSSSSSHRVDTDEEEKSGDQDEESTPPVFWRASANAVEATVDLSEPSTFQEAVNGPDQVHWRKAIHAELKSMRLRGVFRAAKLPNGQRAIGTKWVFKIKRKADGSIEKYKARLVAKGFKQKYGIDYTETFSPVVKYVTLRMVIAIAKYFGWPLDQLDVVTAFLYGIMKEQVFCIVPEGVELDGNFDCLELVKAIDGSTQDQQPSINSLKAFYEDEGIEQQTTVPYAHQTNGTAERAIRTIVTIGRSMLHHAKLDKCFWAEAAMTAIYVKNRLPSPKIEHKTPFEIVYKSKPSVKHMRVFGCRTYILTPKEKRLKWDPKARAGIFLGYEEVSKAYRLYDIEAGQVVINGVQADGEAQESPK